MESNGRAPARQRGAVIITRGGKVALMRRTRDQKRYYLFPGGTVDPGETVEKAATREAYEELGVQVTLGNLVAIVERPDSLQYYFLAQIQRGEFGSGTGEELSSSPDSERGSYMPCWVPVRDLTRYDVRPYTLARAIREEAITGLKAPMRLSD